MQGVRMRRVRLAPRWLAGYRSCRVRWRRYRGRDDCGTDDASDRSSRVRDWPVGDQRPRNARGPVSWAIEVNDKGQVVGASDTRSGKTHAFLWLDGRMRDLGSLAIFATIEINNRGQILGDDAVWQNGKVTNLGTLGGDQTITRDLNNVARSSVFSVPARQAQSRFPLAERQDARPRHARREVQRRDGDQRARAGGW